MFIDGLREYSVGVIGLNKHRAGSWKKPYLLTPCLVFINVQKTSIQLYALLETSAVVTLNYFHVESLKSKAPSCTFGSDNVEAEAELIKELDGRDTIGEQHAKTELDSISTS